MYTCAEHMYRTALCYTSIYKVIIGIISLLVVWSQMPPQFLLFWTCSFVFCLFVIFNRLQSLLSFLVSPSPSYEEHSLISLSLPKRIPYSLISIEQIKSSLGWVQHFSLFVSSLLICFFTVVQTSSLLTLSTHFFSPFFSIPVLQTPQAYSHLFYSIFRIPI